DTLFVVTDQALGIWVPLVRKRPHVIHCHDFLALRSALGEISQNPTGWSGRIYQRLIRRGFRQGRNFISVSHASQRDLHRFLLRPASHSEVVWNGLNYPYAPLDAAEICRRLGKYADEAEKGFVLHVGGNQWYKNRAGVLEIYAAYAASVQKPLPLWMVGAPPSEVLKQRAENIPAPGQVHFFSEFSNAQLQAAYCAAKVLVFPSLAEGFGWPIVEAMACGTPVITTLAPPMTEVGGEEAEYLPMMPLSCELGELANWARHGAELLERTIARGPVRRAALLARAARFSTERALDRYEEIYEEISRSQAH
ncbi:MAG TPA: glycosyltransferase, partial [Chthoniobacterales bacterium]